MSLLLPEPRYFQSHGEIHILTDPLRYFDETSRKKHIVPAGFDSDLASVPRWIPALVVNDMGAITYPAFLHDYMYREKYTTRAEADRIFREFCIERELAKPRAWIAWAGVRINAIEAYKWHRRS